MELIYLVRTKTNTHGELIPININDCPKGKYLENKICQDRSCKCIGLENGKILKQENQMEYTIQCNFVGSK